MCDVGPLGSWKGAVEPALSFCLRQKSSSFESVNSRLQTDRESRVVWTSSLDVTSGGETMAKTVLLSLKLQVADGTLLSSPLRIAVLSDLGTRTQPVML
jgi:hypothetical protein